MPIYLSHLLIRLRRRISWGLPLQVLVFVFVTSWPLMEWAEPNEEIADPGVYWYWFIVTATTVGYGDYSPTTTEGYLVSLYVIIGGVVTITTLFARVAQMIDNAKGYRMKGQRELRLTGHLVVLGYAPGRTEGIISRLSAEETYDIVICAWEDQAEEHPMAHREDIHFVRGNLTEDDVLRRAALRHASAVLVDARHDDEALKVTVAANYVSPDVHTVVALQDLAHVRTVSRVTPNAFCVQWHSPELICEELQDPGMSRFYCELMGHGERNTYSIRVPETLPGRTFGEFQQALGRWNAATIVATLIGPDLHISPSWRDEIPIGTVFYYIARRRLRTHDLERYVDRSEQILVNTEQELLREEWR